MATNPGTPATITAVIGGRRRTRGDVLARLAPETARRLVKRYY